MTINSKGPDVLAAGTFGAYIVAWLARATPVLQELALLAAIVSGFAAALFHLTKWVFMLVDRIKGKAPKDE